MRENNTHPKKHANTKRVTQAGNQSLLRELESLRASERRFRHLYNNAVIGIYRTTPDGRIVDANPTLVDMLGFSSFEELAKRNLEREGFEPGYSRAEFKRSVEAHGTVRGLESLWTRRDGTTLWVRENARVIRDDEGKTLYYEGTVEDISARKEAEDKLLDYHDRLRRLAAELTLTEERERCRIAEHLHDRVAQTLVFVKMKMEQFAQNQEKQELRVEQESLCAMLAESIVEIQNLTFELSSPVLKQLGLVHALESWLQEIVERRYNISTVFIPTVLPSFLPDDLKAILYRSVKELCINAIKHGRPQEIKVTMQQTNDVLTIEVADNGVGFCPEVLEVDSPHRGFGLFSITERFTPLGGGLYVESRPGEGCRAVLSIPLR